MPVEGILVIDLIGQLGPINNAWERRRNFI